MRTKHTLDDFFVEHKASAEQRKKFTEALIEERYKRRWRGNGMSYEDLCLLWVNTMY